MKTIILCIVIMIIHTVPLLSQRFICPDSCAFWPDTMPNFPPIRYDSCMTISYVLTNYHYAKSDFLLNLVDGAILPLPKIPSDSIVYYDWRNDIDTTFTILRNRFDSLEKLVGVFTLRRQGPQGANDRYFYIEFDKWVRIDSINNLLTDINNIGMCSHVGRNLVVNYEYTDKELSTIQIIRQENQILVHTDKVVQEIKIWDQKGKLLNVIRESPMIIIPTHCATSLLFIEIICPDKTYIFKEIL